MQMQQLTVSGVCRDEYDTAGPIPYNITSAHIVFQLFFSSTKPGSHFIHATLYRSTFKKNKEGENREDSSCPRRLISFAITLHLLYPPQLARNIIAFPDTGHVYILLTHPLGHNDTIGRAVRAARYF